ncbi:MAG: exodeoxyribonuclease III [Bacillota bacterium]|nr:exodeoxyribonuclease III [Bacillota bacterium]
MRLINWNVNGIRAAIGKGFLDFFEREKPDFLCLQEIKCSEGQVDLDLPGYHQYWNYAERKGYSGTAIFTKHEPLVVTKGIGIPEHDGEGRVITLEYADFYLVTVYTPNAGRDLSRLQYRMEWEDAFRAYLLKLDEKKPVIFCGDLNVAHKEIDLKNPKTNRKNAGFTDEERGKFSVRLESGFTDTYRHLYPDKEGAYTWWSYFSKSREKNIGWRIDYFVVSDSVKEKIKDAGIMPEVMGSDHCPVYLDYECCS